MNEGPQNNIDGQKKSSKILLSQAPNLSGLLWSDAYYFLLLLAISYTRYYLMNILKSEHFS